MLADYLRHVHGLDGLIYPSAQFAKGGGQRQSNIVLFHHASRVAGRKVAGPAGDDSRVASLALDRPVLGNIPDYIRLATIERIDVRSRTRSLTPIAELPDVPF